MRYLGGVSGNGMLKCNGEAIARASYDFDFFRKPTGIATCGEIRLSADTLKGVFGRTDLQLLTDDGQLLGLSFSEKKLLPMADVAHVDVTGDMSAATQIAHH